MKKSLKSEYSQLRRLAEQRSRRLESAGFGGYHAPRLRELDSNNIRKETLKLRRWLDREVSTVKGARADQARKEAEAEARRIRKNQRNQEYRRRKALKEGREMKPVPPKRTEEERRAAKREANRRYRIRVKQERENVKRWLDEQYAQNKKVGQALKNLYSGLTGNGIKIKTVEEMQMWGEYMKERKHDSEKEWYAFMIWLEALAQSANKTVIGRGTNRTVHVTADEIMQFMEDFNRWKADNDALIQDLRAPKKKEEYKQSTFERIWNRYKQDKNAAAERELKEQEKKENRKKGRK